MTPKTTRQHKYNKKAFEVTAKSKTMKDLSKDFLKYN